MIFLSFPPWFGEDCCCDLREVGDDERMPTGALGGVEDDDEVTTGDGLVADDDEVLTDKSGGLSGDFSEAGEVDAFGCLLHARVAGRVSDDAFSFVAGDGCVGNVMVPFFAWNATNAANAAFCVGCTGYLWTCRPEKLVVSQGRIQLPYVSI